MQLEIALDEKICAHFEMALRASLLVATRIVRALLDADSKCWIGNEPWKVCGKETAKKWYDNCKFEDFHVTPFIRDKNRPIAASGKGASKIHLWHRN